MRIFCRDFAAEDCCHTPIEARMIRIAIACVCGTAAFFSAAADSALPSRAADEAVIRALAVPYTFNVVNAARGGCVVRLEAAPAQSDRQIGHPLFIDRRCRARFPVLRLVARWAPTGGASIRLLGGTPLRELSDFSPVQDGSGVYLRGGFAGAAGVFELRPAQ
jgi:hypothetical protein